MRFERFFTYSRGAYTNFLHEERKMRTLLKKPSWDPHGTHVGTMWVLCATLVVPSGKHVGTMWDPCEKLLRNPIGNHVGPT